MNKGEMEYQKWIYCPVCGNKTRVRLRKDTVRMKNRIVSFFINKK